VERFSLADTRRFASQLVSVIKKAHHLGIVHRDLKPANIFLARRDEDEAVKLLDFGAIKCLDPSQQLQHTEPLGTLPYMAPEQLQGEPVDFLTDLWGLAAVLFEMVTGERAFDAVNRLRLRDEICSGPAPRPSLFLPGMEPLDPFFEHAFAKSPADRYATVEEFGRAFATAARACSSPIAPGAAGESIVVPADAEIPSPPILDTTPRSSRGLRRGATTTSPLA
jgi:serine/threonine-protein kinase